MARLYARRTRIALQLISLFAFFSLTAAAAGQDTPWAEKMFDSLNHDFGVVARGADATHRFKVTSLWRDDTHIANVTTSCGCTGVKVGNRTLKSHESTYIEVTMDTERFTYLKNSSVTVTFDAPMYAVVRIPIKAYILPDIVLTPGVIAFGQTDYGQGAERTVTVSSSGYRDWTIKEAKSTSEHLAVRLTETESHDGHSSYELHATLKPTAPVGSLREQVLLITDDPENPQITVLAEAKIENDVTVTPETISLGVLKPGEKKSTRLVVRMKRPFAVECVECESNANSTHLDAPQGTRTIHVVPVTLTAPAEPGKFTRKLTLTLSGRPEPVTIKTYGTVVDESAE
jgi:hypothetical protein